MKHKCLRPKPNIGHQCPIDECSCDCDWCIDRRRVLDLPECTDEELVEVNGWLDETTEGPWEATHGINGFGSMRFITSKSNSEQPSWFRVVAIVENTGGILGDKFIAWCRDGVPRLLKTIVKLKQENEYLRAMLKTRND